MPGSGSTNRPLLVWAVVLVGGVLAGWLFFMCRDHPLSPSSAQVPNSFSNSLPKLGGPPGYISSAACKQCHARQYDSWWQSYHRQMTQAMSSNTVQAIFEGTIMEAGGARFNLHQSGNRFWVDIQGLDEWEAARQTNGPPPVPNRIPMEMVTGSHYFQVFWIPTGHGNRQIGFPFTWLVAEKKWVLRNDAFIRDPDLEPRPEQWNLICIRCHATA